MEFELTQTGSAGFRLNHEDVLLLYCFEMQWDSLFASDFFGTELI